MKIDVTTLTIGQTVKRDGFPELTVVGLGYGKVDAAEVLSGAAKPIEARMTSDGRGWQQEWATADETGPEIAYAERWTREGRVFHGWVDLDSRKIVQVG